MFHEGEPGAVVVFGGGALAAIVVLFGLLFVVVKKSAPFCKEFVQLLARGLSALPAVALEMMEGAGVIFVGVFLWLGFAILRLFRMRPSSGGGPQGSDASGGGGKTAGAAPGMIGTVHAVGRSRLPGELDVAAVVLEDRPFSPAEIRPAVVLEDRPFSPTEIRRTRSDAKPFSPIRRSDAKPTLP